MTDAFRLALPEMCHSLWLLGVTPKSIRFADARQLRGLQDMLRQAVLDPCQHCFEDAAHERGSILKTWKTRTGLLFAAADATAHDTGLQDLSSDHVVGAQQHGDGGSGSGGAAKALTILASDQGQQAANGTQMQID
jgi:hypothetical protein